MRPSENESTPELKAEVFSLHENPTADCDHLIIEQLARLDANNVWNGRIPCLARATKFRLELCLVRQLLYRDSPNFEISILKSKCTELWRLMTIAKSIDHKSFKPISWYDDVSQNDSQR